MIRLFKLLVFGCAHDWVHHSERPSILGGTLFVRECKHCGMLKLIHGQ